MLQPWLPKDPALHAWLHKGETKLVVVVDLAEIESVSISMMNSINLVSSSISFPTYRGSLASATIAGRPPWSNPIAPQW
jgi:hypothetical protein